MIKHHPSIRNQERRWLRRKRLSVPRCPSMHTMRKEFEKFDTNYALYEPPDNPTPEDLLIAKQDSAEIDKAMLLHLSPREEFCLRMYHYGIDDAEPYTLDEIGAVMGVTRERPRQIMAKAYRKLRRKPQIAPFKDKYRWRWSSRTERQNAEREMRRAAYDARPEWSTPIIVPIGPDPAIEQARQRAAFDMDDQSLAQYAAVLSAMLARQRGMRS